MDSLPHDNCVFYSDNDKHKIMIKTEDLLHMHKRQTNRWYSAFLCNTQHVATPKIYFLLGLVHFDMFVSPVNLDTITAFLKP